MLPTMPCKQSGGGIQVPSLDLPTPTLADCPLGVHCAHSLPGGDPATSLGCKAGRLEKLTVLLASLCATVSLFQRLGSPATPPAETLWEGDPAGVRQDTRNTEALAEPHLRVRSPGAVEGQRAFGRTRAGQQRAGGAEAHLLDGCFHVTVFFSDFLCLLFVGRHPGTLGGTRRQSQSGKWRVPQTRHSLARDWGLPRPLLLQTAAPCLALLCHGATKGGGLSLESSHFSTTKEHVPHSEGQDG